MKWESYSHPISDVREWNETQRLELRPSFQRNEVWTRAAQVMLIDTILRGIPIPKIYIKSIVKDEKTYRIVIDGQQRLTAILKFINDELILDKPYKGEFIGKKFSELPKDIHDDFIRYKIDINEIFNPTDEEIRDLYSRVNKYTVQLNKQELRRADFPGDFINLAEELSENEFFSKSNIFSVRLRRRMLDIEYIEELLTIIINGVQDKKDYIDSMCETNMVMPNKDEIKVEFLNILNDINIIFNSDIISLSNSRFKQKSDFYSIFACILNLRKNNKLTDDIKILNEVRNILKDMDSEIGPQSENQEYLEYATRCLSDANSKVNRIWRIDYLTKFISRLYI